MKAKFFALIATVALVSLFAGCYGTVTQRTKPGMPFVKDKVEGRYERSADEVFNAAKEVVKFNGTLVSENILHSATNAVQTLDGRVNQRHVYIRVEQIEPKLSLVIVQARTAGGGRDLDLAHELEKQIALKLVR